MDIDTTVLGKSVSDVQTGVTVNNNSFSGTLKYVEGWTEFSGDPNEQNGNFLIFHSAMTNADKITIQIINAKTRHEPVELDPDGIAVCRISDKNTQLIQVVAYKDGEAQQKLFSLRGLTLETEA